MPTKWPSNGVCGAGLRMASKGARNAPRRARCPLFLPEWQPRRASLFASLPRRGTHLVLVHVEESPRRSRGAGGRRGRPQQRRARGARRRAPREGCNRQGRAPGRQPSVVRRSCRRPRAPSAPPQPPFAPQRRYNTYNPRHGAVCGLGVSELRTRPQSAAPAALETPRLARRGMRALLPRHRARSRAARACVCACACEGGRSAHLPHGQAWLLRGWRSAAAQRLSQRRMCRITRRIMERRKKTTASESISICDTLRPERAWQWHPSKTLL